MIEFIEIAGKPDSQTFKQIEEFYKSIFGEINAEKFTKRITDSENLLTVLAFREIKIVGFKIGYEIAPRTFYSWIGGVDENFRKKGIAGELLQRQHKWCLEKGFEKIQTKTKNSFKSMLILNIKNGFDVVDVYKNVQGESKIVLEKNLLKS